MKGLNPRNQWVRIADRADGGEEVTLYVEAASNPVILDYVPFVADARSVTSETAGRRASLPAAAADLAVFDETGLGAGQRPRGARRPDARATGGRTPAAGRSCARCRAGAGRARPAGRRRHRAAARAPCWRRCFAAPAAASAHRISAIGHAHIDSAWLWPMRETVRKVRPHRGERASTCWTDDPEFVFAMSSAQQLRVARRSTGRRCSPGSRAAIADGRFVPVGGMWVESDTNMPGGEALARQFVHGKRYFLEKFGVETEEVWLPDSFGYTAALPQLVALSASKWFLTQKISWNRRTSSRTTRSGGRASTAPGSSPTSRPSTPTTPSCPAANWRTRRGTSARRAARRARWSRSAGATAAAARPARCWPRARRLADLEGSPRVTIEKPADVLRGGAGGVPATRRSGRASCTWSCTAARTPPGEDQAGQPAQRAPAARGRAVVPHGGRPARRRRTPTTSWTGSGRRCCCTSSTTSCPARRSPGCTARRGRPTPRSPRNSTA